MEDIREVALAYYANSSDETKKVANDFFKSIDADGNGVITCYEFETFAKKIWGEFDPELFAVLDKNGDGCLDYEEVIVLFYMAGMIFYYCDSCGKHLRNQYFTCVQCFQTNSSNQTYDLCPTCYKTKQFTHGHNFIDNYAMLHLMRKKVAQPAYATTERSAQGNRGIDWNGVGQTVFKQASQQVISNPDQATDAVDAIVGLLLSACSIM